MEERMARIEGMMEQMDKRLNHIETEISELRAEINALRSELRGEISSNFKWTLGLLIPMWVSIIATVLLRG